jgi:hypothetical protein
MGSATREGVTINDAAMNFVYIFNQNGGCAINVQTEKLS